MQNQFLLTPYFLDRYSPELAALQTPTAWAVNAAALPDGSIQQRMAAALAPLADFAADAAAQGRRPVSVAGDCCSAIGFLAGLQRAGLDPVLLWLDAHGDFNTWETTPSGFLGGMPLAMLTGRGEQTLMQAAGARPLPDARVVLCDGRDLDPGEALALQASGVAHVTALDALLAHPRLQDRPLYIHFDTDIVDPADSPAMSYPAPGGPSLAETRAVFRQLAQTHQIVGVSLSTWNPDLDADGRTRAASLSLLFDLVGEENRGSELDIL